MPAELAARPWLSFTPAVLPTHERGFKDKRGPENAKQDLCQPHSHAKQSLAILGPLERTYHCLRPLTWQKLRVLDSEYFYASFLQPTLKGNKNISIEKNWSADGTDFIKLSPHFSNVLDV
jgi:hypothetical protein